MVGQNIGKYRILDRIGRGGMGTVYRATDETLHREVAIKVLNAELNDPGVARRFRAEAVTVARLSHPGLATIYELFQHDGQWLMVMEFVRGETLEALVSRSGPLAVEAAAPLCMQALNALAHAHSMGVVHRDLKPANIMVAESTMVKVMDFGIARVAGTEHLTSAGFLMGTPAYMAPEQVTGGEVDARADLYALGVVFFHLLTGALPFPGATPFEMAQSRVSRAPIPVRTIRADLPAWVEQVLVIALARDPAGRYQSAAFFHEALRRGLAHLPLDTPEQAAVRPELIATARPGSMPVIPADADAALRTGASDRSIASSHHGTGTLAPTSRTAGVSPGSTGLGPVALTEAIGRVAPERPSAGPAAPPTGTQPAPADAVRTIAGRSPASPDTSTVPASPRRGVTPLVAAAAAVVVVALAGWFWLASGSEPPTAVAQSPAVDPAPASGEPASLPTPPPVATAPPAPPVAGAGGTTPSTVAPAATTGIGGTTPSRRRAPADPRLAFEDVRVLLVTGRRSEEQDATLAFGAGQIAVAGRRDTVSLGVIRYEALARATYTRGRNPKWDAALASPAPDTDFPGGLFRGARHWLVLQSSATFMILRLSDTTWRDVVEAVTARSGVPVRQASDGQ